MSKFRLSTLTKNNPWLDELRTSFLSNICIWGINWWESTYRIDRVISKKAKEYLDSGKPAIFAIYHGRMIGMLRVFEPRDKITLLISLSRDGEFIARIASGLGYRTARGSPAFKATEGALQLIAAAKAGQHLMITVDGPRGPGYKVAPGVIKMAELTALPIIPFVSRVRTGILLNTWDHIMGGYLCSPMLYMLGDPIIVPSNLSDERREDYRLNLEQTMDKMRLACDQYWQL